MLEPIRQILCPPAIDDQLAGRLGGEFPTVGAAVTIGWFIAGHVLRVSRKRRHKKQKKGLPNIEMLEGMDEIWVLCHRKPGSGWRLVGRFLERDVLVVLRVRDKRDIGTDYRPVADEVTEDWKRYFGSQPPCHGDWISGYLSGSHFDADEEKQI
jgi:hypothetical protein